MLSILHQFVEVGANVFQNWVFQHSPGIPALFFKDKIDHEISK